MTEAFNGPPATRFGARRGEGSAARREYHVEAAGTRLFVKEMGDGPPLVVLHGGPGAHHDYLLPYFQRLADDYHLYFYDQRGGGRSQMARPTEIGWRDHVADLDALREGWALERLNLVGYSWGGLLALLYASEHPDRVRLMVLVDPAAAWGDYHRQFKVEFERRNGADAVKEMKAELEASGLRERDPEAYRQRRFELSVAGYFRDPRDARGLTPFCVQAQAEQATWASLRGHGSELRRALRALRTPTLVVHGRHDPVPLAWAEELVDTLPMARLVVLDKSGHVPYVEQPERTFEVIRGFLEEQLRG